MDCVKESVYDHLVDIVDVGLPDFGSFTSQKKLTIGVQKTRNRLAFVLDVVVSDE